MRTAFLKYLMRRCRSKTLRCCGRSWVTPETSGVVLGSAAVFAGPTWAEEGQSPAPPPPREEGDDPVEALRHTLLEAGADDVISDDDGAIEVLTSPFEFEAVRDALEAAGLKPEMAEVVMRPENTIELSGEDAVRMQKLLDVLEDLDDVQAISHNAAF